MPLWKNFVVTENDVDDDDLPLEKYRLYDDDGKLKSPRVSVSPPAVPSSSFTSPPRITLSSGAPHPTVTYASTVIEATHKASRGGIPRPDTPAVMTGMKKNGNSFEGGVKRARSATQRPRSRSPAAQKPCLEVVHSSDDTAITSPLPYSGTPSFSSLSSKSPSVHPPDGPGMATSSSRGNLAKNRPREPAMSRVQTSISLSSDLLSSPEVSNAIPFDSPTSTSSRASPAARRPPSSLRTPKTKAVSSRSSFSSSSSMATFTRSRSPSRAQPSSPSRSRSQPKALSSKESSVVGSPSEKTQKNTKKTAKKKSVSRSPGGKKGKRKF